MLRPHFPSKHAVIFPKAKSNQNPVIISQRKYRSQTLGEDNTTFSRVWGRAQVNADIFTVQSIHNVRFYGKVQSWRQGGFLTKQNCYPLGNGLVWRKWEEAEKQKARSVMKPSGDAIERRYLVMFFPRAFFPSFDSRYSQLTTLWSIYPEGLLRNPSHA